MPGLKITQMCLAILPSNQTKPLARYNVNRADFDNMHAALCIIDWLDIMEHMDTQEA